MIDKEMMMLANKLATEMEEAPKKKECFYTTNLT